MSAVAICGANTVGPPESVGCGKGIWDPDALYRCVECGTPFHRVCAALHFDRAKGEPVETNWMASCLKAEEELARERTRAAALEWVAAAARALRKACVPHGEVQQRVSNIEVRALCDALDRLDAAGVAGADAGTTEKPRGEGGTPPPGGRSR